MMVVVVVVAVVVWSSKGPVVELRRKGITADGGGSSKQLELITYNTHKHTHTHTNKLTDGVIGKLIGI
jgi:hypothetical protein